MLRFGRFEFDAEQRRLRRDGADVHLEPKAFELLASLIDAAPRVVAKAELHDHLWPRSVVSDATLVALVKDLRRALDDRKRDRHVIRTVHRVGYAFELPVERAGAPAGAAHWLTTGDRRLPLAAGENIVGRAALASVRIDHSTVSRHHARIVVDGDEVHMEDLASKNGTTVGGNEVAAPIALHNGDLVSFGEVRLTYRRTDASPSTVTQLGRVDPRSPGG
jgi:DNA-binding winged helix-turn-helix (wHTH) protein